MKKIHNTNRKYVRGGERASPEWGKTDWCRGSPARRR